MTEDKQRNIYLNKKSLKEARERWWELLKCCRLTPEIINTAEAAGRISAGQVRASRSSPHFYAAAMDGYALRAEDTRGINERNPGKFRVPDEAVEINTGEPVPASFNAVIKIEDVEQKDENKISIFKSLPPWHNVRSIGESILQGEQILCTGEKISAEHVGALLEAGIENVEVFSAPALSIVPTGDEIVSPSRDPKRGEMVEFNSAMISARSSDLLSELKIFDICPDDPDKLKENLSRAAKMNDIVAVIAGSSAGDRDYTADVLEELGEVIVHGVNIMPGKPVLLGKIDSVPVIGLPGYPVSCLLVYDLFLNPALKILQGKSFQHDEEWPVEVKRKISSAPGREEFIRVNLKYEGEDESERFTAVPRRRGSAVMKSMLQADGYLRIPSDREGLSPGERARVIPFKKRSEIIDKGLLLIGSNDPALEELRELMFRQEKIDLKLQSRGSQAGIHSLLRKEADITASHLLDPETGEYNIPYLEETADSSYSLLTMAHRWQGFIFRKDSSARDMEDLEDLASSDLVFINRQRGAGTRILLDYKLSQQGITPADIEGYKREEYTHAAVAQAVSSGSADVALGISAAADAFSLEFTPLFQERFELIFDNEVDNNRKISVLIEKVKSQEFVDKLKKMEGYEVNETGRLRNYAPDKRGEYS